MTNPTLRTLCGALLPVAMAACATARIPNTEVVDTPENRAVVAVVERYRTAMETRDAPTLRAMASKHYYENASTTASAEDDWGFPNLEEVLKRLTDNVKSVTYDVHITDLQIYGERADVDFELTWAFQYTDGERDGWTRKTDTNRLELIREDGDWHILSGM